MIDFANLHFEHRPYPLGLATGVFDAERYERMVANFPAEEWMAEMNGAYKKRSLSEVNNPGSYRSFVKAGAVWYCLHEYVKSREFIEDVLSAISTCGIDVRRLAEEAHSARFEFSSMPADGGRIDPHTDIPSKVITIVIPMVRPGEWNSSWGGGTDILVPARKDVRYADYKNPLSDFERFGMVPFEPNQALVFLKTSNSWHSVGPIQGPRGRWRRSLTVNIERKNGARVS